MDLRRHPRHSTHRPLPVLRLRRSPSRVGANGFEAEYFAIVHSAPHWKERSRTDGTGLAKLRAEWKATNGKVAFFPFVVFDRDITANASTDNLLKILGSLLIPTEGKTG